jgi:hypothetical protein
MPAKSHAHCAAVLNHFLRNVSQTSPATVYAGLLTVAPTPSTAGTEVSGGSYARVAVTFGAPASGVTSNSAPVNFAAASAPWGTVVAVGIYDALSGGNLLYFGTLGSSKVIGTSDTASFAAAALSITEQ